jgi:hypothetical protein
MCCVCDGCLLGVAGVWGVGSERQHDLHTQGGDAWRESGAAPAPQMTRCCTNFSPLMGAESTNAKVPHVPRHDRCDGRRWGRRYLECVANGGGVVSFGCSTLCHTLTLLTSELCQAHPPRDHGLSSKLQLVSRRCACAPHTTYDPETGETLEPPFTTRRTQSRTNRDFGRQFLMLYFRSCNFRTQTFRTC